MAYYLVLKKVTKKENIGFAIFMLSILFLFTGVSAKFKGPFLLGRIYQGKAIFVNIIIPLVIAKFLDYKKFSKEDYIILVITYIGSLALTPMTISLLSLLYGLFELIILIRKDYKEFKKAIFIMIPIVAICGIYLLLACLGNQTLESLTDLSQFNQFEDFKSFLDKGIGTVLLYIISIIIICIRGNKNQKNIGVILPLVAAILVFNPLLTNIYIKLVTKDTYWRLYWILPIEITIIIAFIIIYDMIKDKKIKYIFCIFIIGVFILSGKYMYTEERGFSKFQNFEKIPQYIIDETSYILQRTEGTTKVVAPLPPWESCMMRQCSTKIILMHSRDHYSLENEYRNTFRGIYNEIYSNESQEYDINEINNLKDQYDVEWVILPKNKKILIDENLNYVVEMENEYNYILRAN